MSGEQFLIFDEEKQYKFKKYRIRRDWFWFRRPFFNYKKPLPYDGCRVFFIYDNKKTLYIGSLISNPIKEKSEVISTMKIKLRKFINENREQI